MKTVQFFRLTAFCMLFSAISADLFAQNTLNVHLHGLQEGDSALVVVQQESEYLFKKWAQGNGQTVTVPFNIPDGKWAVLLDATGYDYPAAQVFDLPSAGSELEITLTPFEADGFIYQWSDDDSHVGHARQTYINEPTQIIVLDQLVPVPSDFSAINLRYKFGIVLSNELENWSIEDSYRLFKTISELPTFNRYGEGNAVNLEEGQNVQAIFKLSNDEIADDILIEHQNGLKVVTLSSSAMTYAEPMTVLMDDIKGRYYSKRLSRAMINYLTDFGRDGYAAQRLAQEMFGLSFMEGNQETEELMGEDASNFQEFHATEKVEILAMLQELPTGMHKQDGLRYLVRRVNGQDHPQYTTAAAIAWTSMNTIEFMSKAFAYNMIENIRRLILHEKAHFLWEYTFDEQLKDDWIELGGWFQDPSVPSGWQTTNTTEFVSAYGHAINPNEDMAETIAWYVTNPDGLRSRSMRKFEFVRDRIMHGTRYQSIIREDLTFQVYNLFPDYVYPGKVIGTEVRIAGEPESNKEVFIKIRLNSTNLPYDGASSGYLRLASRIGTIFDIGLYPQNGSVDSVLIGRATMNRFMKAGYWHLSSLTISDNAGNNRYENTASMGFKFYLNNPEEDVRPPFYNQDTKFTYIEQHPNYKDEQGNPMPAILAQYSFYDDSPLFDTAVSVMFPKSDSSNQEHYSIRYGESSHEALNGNGTDSNNGFRSVKYMNMYHPIPEYFPNGTYAISQVNAQDIAGNGSIVYLLDETQDMDVDQISRFKDDRPYLVINTPYPDTKHPELDLNNISVSAAPTIPESPNGETRVELRIRAQDASDFSGKEAGIKFISYRLRDPQGQEFTFREEYEADFGYDPHNIHRGEQEGQWKTYNLNTTLPVGSAPGLWGVSSIQLRDRAGNFKNYSFEEYVRFDVIESEITLTQPLAVELSSHTVNTSTITDLDMQISCSPSAGLQYKYTIYSDGGGSVNTGIGEMTADTVYIENLDLTNVEDGNLNVTIQLLDEGNSLIATASDRIVKDTVVPVDYGYHVELSSSLASSAPKIGLELFFSPQDSAGRYQLILEKAASKESQSKTTNLLVWEDQINRTQITLDQIDLDAFDDGIINQRLMVWDAAGNEGVEQITQYIKEGGQLTEMNEDYIQTLLPAHESTIEELSPLFSWTTENSEVDYFQLQCASDSTFASLVLDIQTVENSYQLEEPLEGAKTYYWRVRPYSGENVGNWSLTRAFKTPVSTSLDELDLPTEFQLKQNYPNPFNPVTSIRFALPTASAIELEVYNIMGQRVAILQRGTLKAGWHTVNWDASALPTGIYIYRLRAGEFVQSRKMMLLK